jgi:hypothetical protein
MRARLVMRQIAYGSTATLGPIARRFRFMRLTLMVRNLRVFIACLLVMRFDVTFHATQGLGSLSVMRLTFGSSSKIFGSLGHVVSHAFDVSWSESANL